MTVTFKCQLYTILTQCLVYEPSSYDSSQCLLGGHYADILIADLQ